MTGSLGLIGTSLTQRLRGAGYYVRELDIRGSGLAFGDTRSVATLARALDGVDGVVHLAAVSRVILAERDEKLTEEVNVIPLDNILRLICASSNGPWLIFASSREVYGESPVLPVHESMPLAPVNIYGRAKVRGEELIAIASELGVRASIVRFSNVFGSIHDHIDRVVPAFAREAAFGGELRIDGAEHTFDFTHIDDVARGVVDLVRLLVAGERPPPPIQFVTGQPTTLAELATIAIEEAKCHASVRHAPERKYDVAKFYGCPKRARQILGWSARVDVRSGIRRMIAEYRASSRKSGTPKAPFSIIKP